MAGSEISKKKDGSDGDDDGEDDCSSPANGLHPRSSQAVT